MTFNDWNNPNGPFRGFPFGGFPFGGGGAEDPDPEPQEARPSLRDFKLPFSKKTLLLLALLLIVVIGLPMIANFLADYYWYESEKIASVFWTRLLPQWALLLVFSVLAFLLVYPNLKIALGVARDLPGGRDGSRSGGNPHAQAHPYDSL